MRTLVTREMVVETTAYLCDRLPRDAEWEQRAGSLEWTCRQTLVHIGDGLLWYSTQLVDRVVVGATPLND